MNQDNHQNTTETLLNQRISQNFGDRFRNFLKAPIFSDDLIKTRKAAILHAFLVSMLMITTLYSVVILFTSASPALGLALVGSVQLFTISSYVALKRGHVKVISFIFVLFLWLLLSTATVLFGDPVNPLLASLILVVFSAGQLLSNRAAAAYAILSVIFAILLL